MPAPLSERNRNYLDFIAPIAADPGCRIFAVLDGAFFANVSADLRDVAGITYRALYRYGGNYAVVVGGPWLANPYRQNPAAPGYVHSSRSGGLPPPDDAGNVELVISRLENILRVAGEKPGLVFWVGDASLTEEALFKHLRRLNQVLVPKERDSAEASTGELLAAAADQEERAATAQGYEPVVFRHADANVMAQVLPALDAAQFSRLFGPCRQIIYAPADDWGGGINRVRRTGELLPPPGPLRWTAATMEKIREARTAHLARDIAGFLRETAPAQTGGISDADLAARTLGYLREARQLGVTHDQAFAKWAFMRTTRIFGPELEKVRLYMTSTSIPHSANDRVKYLTRFYVKLEQEAR